MHRFILGVFLVMLVNMPVNADNGVVNVKSMHSVKDTANKLEAVLKKKGMKIFTRINHAKGAQSVGVDLRPTELVIFGNPKVGAPFMACGQRAAIDLPQKALIWQDIDGQVWLSYNDPAYVANRHGTKGCEKVIKKITGALAKFSKAATH